MMEDFYVFPFQKYNIIFIISNIVSLCKISVADGIPHLCQNLFYQERPKTSLSFQPWARWLLIC